jgi:hypothetical protein
MKKQFHERLIDLVPRSPDPRIADGLGVMGGSFETLCDLCFITGCFARFQLRAHSQ